MFHSYLKLTIIPPELMISPKAHLLKVSFLGRLDCEEVQMSGLG